MAIPIGINELINGQIVESNRIEFKADLNPTSVLHSICAFANDIDNIGGGYIVIGVEEENGTPKFPIKGIERDRIDGLHRILLANEPLNFCLVFSLVSSAHTFQDVTTRCQYRQDSDRITLSHSCLHGRNL